MAVADDDAPGVRADRQFLAVVEPPEAVGQRVDVLAEVAEACAVGFDGRRGPAGEPDRPPCFSSRRRSSIEPLTSQASEYSSPGL